MKHIFHIYHPAVVFCYIAAALVAAMVTRNPVAIGISFLAGSGYAVYLRGARAYLKTLRMVAVLFVVVAVLNPLFNHNGVTAWFYLFDNPVTVEACYFGLAMGGMLATIIVWFSVYNEIMTGDKFLYLFGKALPTAALMMSMIARLVPTSRAKIGRIRAAQTVMGLGAKTGSWRQRVAHGVRISSILMSWTMEDSIETAESMNARGYGSGKRTSFTAYKWTAHDFFALGLILCLSGAAGYMLLGPFPLFEYYPILGGSLFSGEQIAGYVVYALLLLFPLMLEARETIRWRIR